jgi:hypothetical protein
MTINGNDLSMRCSIVPKGRVPSGAQFSNSTPLSPAYLYVAELTFLRVPMGVACTKEVFGV